MLLREMSKKFINFFTALCVFFFAQISCLNAEGLSLIRDAETEKFLRELTNPIFKAAGLDPKNIKIYIINDDSINAFVAGGQNVFINTGLIQKYATPDALIGVLAHETGHITSGHLVRASEGQAQASGAMFLSYLLGIGAIVAGAPDAGAALIMGGGQTAQRLYMKFTREQEEAADAHAIEYLAKLQYPANGLVDLLQSFQNEMVGMQGQIDEYLLSHPVSQKRIDVIKARTAGKNYSDKKMNQKLQPQMNFIAAKLEGFIGNPDSVLRQYENRSDTFSNYKKSIAFSKKGNVDAALILLDPIIAENPQNGFLLETKGQFLFESGRIEDSIIAYDKAIKMLDAQTSAQIKIAFATAIFTLKKNDPTLVKLGIKRLNEAKDFESDNPFLFRQLASGYDKIDDEGRSMLALAEFNLLVGEKDKCKKYAKEAKEKLDKKNKADLLRADDLIDLAKEDEKDKK
jgi:predicted Zn-dependent protease